MLKWANKYLGIQRLQSWSVYGDSNSFSMVVLGKKMNCQKVAPFLWNLPTFKKRTHQFWVSKVSGAFPDGLCAKVLLPNVFYNHQVGQPRNFYQNSSILIKMRGEFPKLSMEIYNTERKCPCPPVLNFKVLPFSQMWSDFDEIRYQVRFQWVENRVRISRL